VTVVGLFFVAHDVRFVLYLIAESKRAKMSRIEILVSMRTRLKARERTKRIVLS
jgi:hypothetical protein